jgi:hypothetical protein
MRRLAVFFAVSLAFHGLLYAGYRRWRGPVVAAVKHDFVKITLRFQSMPPHIGPPLPELKVR